MGRRKKKQQMSTEDDDQYVDLSDDEIVVEDDDDDDLSDLYPGILLYLLRDSIISIIGFSDFRRLRTSDLKVRTTVDGNDIDHTNEKKRKAQVSQVNKEK